MYRDGAMSSMQNQAKASENTLTTTQMRDVFASLTLDSETRELRSIAFDRWFASEIEKAERRSRTEFADELTRKGVYSFDIHSIRRYAGD